MNKKKYSEPSLKVYELERHCHILAGSVKAAMEGQFVEEDG